MQEQRAGEDFWQFVRERVIGAGAALDTPFGSRRLTYADHTASGRGVTFIEDQLRAALELYGNTHTEDDATGTVTSERLLQAEAAIKRLVNAGPEHKIVVVGTGTTAAVHQLQQILGIYIPPAGKDFFQKLLRESLGAERWDYLSARLEEARPVVFVGPYEHHSNEVSWRECFAEVVEIELTAGGLLDLDDLAAKVSLDRYAGRRRIGAFSAASNVSGVKTPVFDVARILHRGGALAFFDFAAIAPYEPIDMRRDPEACFDALYFSPHKFLGGPGSSGVLIFHERIYRADLPPTVGAGGTVDFVNFDGQAYSSDIEVREKPGTPGILQTMRAALAMELKEKLDPARIAAREGELVRRVHAVLSANPAIELMGDVGPEHRLPIFSFNIRVGPSWLHPRFVTRLLNDLFGIQSRAGCSCAAPYGHRILHIDVKKSSELRRSIMRGNIGLKPGWVRLNFHFLHTDEEVDFLCRAIAFVAERGKQFLPLYRFEMHTGAWEHTTHRPAPAPFGLEAALAAARSPAEARGPAAPPDGALFAGYLAQAAALADQCAAQWSEAGMESTEKDLIPFVYYPGGAPQDTAAGK
jgi:selenocysteine lyase/cysteine desulfurase